MKKSFSYGLLSTFVMATAGCGIASGDEKPVAPEPLKAIDAARFYQGRWYEIARTPMTITNGCVAGTTDYSKDDKGQLIDRDACRADTPEGKEKIFDGPVTILDPGKNTKISVRYTLAGILPVSKTYWMLDHDANYSWFIVADPAFKNLSVFTRNPRPSPEEVRQLVAEAKSFGYETKKLEYPAQFPPGEGEFPGH